MALHGKLLEAEHRVGGNNYLLQRNAQNFILMDRDKISIKKLENRHEVKVMK